MVTSFMGAPFPMVPKGIGFDPGATARLFATAFQDVIVFGVFPGLAMIFIYRV